MSQFPFPHPVVNEGAGRVKSDCLNDQRIETILDRFYEVAREQGRKLNLIITKEQVDKSRILFPLTGLAVALFLYRLVSLAATLSYILDLIILVKFSHYSLGTWAIYFTKDITNHTTCSDILGIMTVFHQKFRKQLITTMQDTPITGLKMITKQK